jgi:TldD protein
MTNKSITRRTFVTAASLASAATLLGTRRLDALGQTVRLPAGVGSSPLPADAFFPDPIAPLDLRHLATRAIEAATQAGATYADARIGERHLLELRNFYSQPDVYMTSTLTYGVRVLVDGAWAFVHGSVPTVDAITTSARHAVTEARMYASLAVRRAELAPAPVATGEWATPVQVDPFAVPLRDHGAMMATYTQLSDRTPHTQLGANPVFLWTREARVFASSEGALTTQRLCGVSPSMGVAAPEVFGWVNLRFPLVAATAGGYEILADPARHGEAFITLAENVLRYQRLPRVSMDVGRYPVAVDGSAMGMMFGRTVATALELDRVLGEEADASGTSYLSPPLELLGTAIASPKLTVTATRALPTPSAARWDDEGVMPHDYPVISEGRLVNYHTSRWTAPALRTWYERQGQPLHSNGCAVATDAGEPPAVRAPHLSVMPSLASASLEALCRDVKDGVLVLGTEDLAIDQQFASGSISATRDGPNVGVILKLAKGKIVARVAGNGLNTVTKKLWKEQLVALGDASTVQQTDFQTRKGMPWRESLQSTSAPAALFKDVDVVAFQQI